MKQDNLDTEGIVEKQITPSNEIELLDNLNHLNDVDERINDCKVSNEVETGVSELIYGLLTDVSSSAFTYVWSLTLNVCIIIYFIVLFAESVDGPNHYNGRSDKSRYPFLLNYDVYWWLKVGIMGLPFFDASVRICLILYVSIYHRSGAVFKSFCENDQDELVLTILDIIGVVPFFVSYVIAGANGMVLSMRYRSWLSVLNIASLSRIARLVRHYSSVWAIRIAITRAGSHLILPIFFFLVFNITGAVAFYFAEPCYNLSTCPWVDLPEAMFFSIITMTTVGYGSKSFKKYGTVDSHVGNQIPAYFFGRFLAVIGKYVVSFILFYSSTNISNTRDDFWCDFFVNASCYYWCRV
jgi:hypothetical protein